MVSHFHGVGVAINADHLGQKTFGQDGLTVLLLLADYLQKDAASDIRICSLVDNGEIHAIEYEAPDIGQRDVAAFFRVVQAPVGILFNDSGCAHTYL